MELGEDDDICAFEATLSLMKECAIDTFSSADFSDLLVTLDVSSSFQLGEQPSQSSSLSGRPCYLPDHLAREAL
ncbi:hypothetical protein CCR75_004380 [Bremia lactucae]|uniref:Uncharacterized protein n=1 Tax=Bremia lactucae TaxID=4779 RepID=A0A976FJM4_BRELC|nr:hypothetical protein CCR75_004380 [Bremia lactucae]